MVKLSEDVTLDPELIERATYIQPGSKIEGVIVAAGSSARTDLSAAEDEVIIHSVDGSAVAIRGSEASKHAWEQLSQIRKEKQLKFAMETKG